MARKALTQEQILARVNNPALNAATRLELIKQLRGLERRDRLPALAQALHDPEQVIRLTALEAIRKVGGPDAVDVLINALRHEDERTAYWATVRLRQLNYWFSGPAILAVAEERWASLNDDTRASFLVTLTRFRQPEAIPLLKLAVMSSHRGVRLQAASALRAIDSVESREVLDWALSKMSPSHARAIRKRIRRPGPLRRVTQRLVARMMDRL